MLKIGIIGLGDISPIHLHAINNNPDATLTAACDLDEMLAVPGAAFYTDYQEMLDKEELDCVHICLPHHLHYPATKACVEKGVHVSQEKPLALDAEEGGSLVRLEEANPEVKICICLQNRFNESFEKLREIVESGKYGKVTGIKALVAWYRPKAYYEAKPWRSQMKLAGGGVMINQALHTMDLMQLLGGKIAKIKGSIDQLLDYGVEVEDTAMANIQFENGASGLFFATNANSINSSVELQVILEKGKFTIKDSILTQSIDDEKVKIIEDEKLLGSKFYYGASHAKLINQFYRCIQNDTDDYVHAKEAQVSMEMIQAIRDSSNSRKEIAMEDY